MGVGRVCGICAALASAAVPCWLPPAARQCHPGDTCDRPYVVAAPQFMTRYLCTHCVGAAFHAAPPEACFVAPLWRAASPRVCRGAAAAGAWCGADREGSVLHMTWLCKQMHHLSGGWVTGPPALCKPQHTCAVSLTPASVCVFHAYLSFHAIRPVDTEQCVYTAPVLPGHTAGAQPETLHKQLPAQAGSARHTPRCTHQQQLACRHTSSTCACMQKLTCHRMLPQTSPHLLWHSILASSILARSTTRVAASPCVP